MTYIKHAPDEQPLVRGQRHTRGRIKAGVADNSRRRRCRVVVGVSADHGGGGCGDAGRRAGGTMQFHAQNPKGRRVGH